MEINMIKQSAFLLVSLILLVCSCKETKPADEHSPETSLADLKTYDGLKVGLFASEPMFSNPTNISIDSRGRIWVCEAYNYRNQLNPKNPVKEKGDRIMILEDTDGDGVADKSKVFYQGTDVNAALGICVLGNKIYVSCSPNVFVFTDENGDDVPDKKEVLFTGIQGEQHDHGMHTFTFGHDGRLYFNMGNEGKLLLTASGDTVVDVHGRKVVTNGKPFRQGMALRMDMDGSNVEVLGHNFRNNYELAVDPYGTVWQSDNDDDGNKGVRINYVMEQGNYGFTDEMTGAGWRARRTNLEKEIPLRHWHLNDPGVVPNLLQTGSGSPTGIMIYEGTMLPEVFRSQLIHCEPGHNVVRSYVVENDGAGYKAKIVNLVEAEKDQWFRPSDVAAAPDGSIFIADWYDPGVGGHQVGDLDRGRIYRVTPPDTRYTLPKIDLTSAQGAVMALLNPNMDIRYQGYQALVKMGSEAEAELQKLWKGENPRHRAQAFWLLAGLENKRDALFNEALTDEDANIRITALRAARQLKWNVLTTASKLKNDPSPQVRRDVAIAIRGINSAEAANIWTELALQYDGNDRWYLEALGISADPNWDLYFDTWRKKVGKDWNKPANKDIVWRSRSKSAMPLLAQLISASDDKEMLRYYRAFDFHTDASKQKVLTTLITSSKDAKLLYALKHVDARNFTMTPAVRAKLNSVLDKNKGQLEFVELIAIYNLENKAPDLLEVALQYPDSASGREASRVLLNWGREDLFEKVLASNKKEQTIALIKSLRPHIYDRKAMLFMEDVFMDSTRDVEIRTLAVRSFAGPWQSENRLLELAKENKIPQDLHVAAGGVFQAAWRGDIREEGAKYIKLPGGKEGEPLPAVSTLADTKGDAANGKEVFKNVCGNCHQINNEGTNFGPDLSEIGGKLSKEAIYNSILFPDQGISFGYEGYRFQLKDGSTAMGKIVSETEEKIDLQYMTSQQSVDKAQVVSRTKMETSLMPGNLHSTMSRQDLVDLVEYLSGLKKTVAAR
ncbi:MAG TPA: PVC-type heme-binding CxxCH protein [Chryseosolibacter sp.]|nr:PVC-type heme-binding CxxCH protein [Chryseosolibacter sp.]